ncbi:MAG: hypothetical protein ACTSXQ_00975 [Alphaproteobacteria bacterium]
MDSQSNTVLSPDARFNDLVEITDQLSHVLQEEIDLLRNRPKVIAENLPTIQQRKLGLSRIYQGHIDFLTNNPTFLKEVANDRKETLKEKTQSFNLLVREDARLLEVARKTSERVANTIINAIRKEATKSTPYASSLQANNNNVKPVSYSLNREI